MTELVYGDRTQATATVKYISLLVCFLVSFTCFIHSARLASLQASAAAHL
jgi:hypothetical protein